MPATSTAGAASAAGGTGGTAQADNTKSSANTPPQPAANAVVIDPKDPQRVYAATPSGVYRSNDAGQTWEATSAGLPGEGVSALALDPRHPEHLFALLSSGALYRSEDGAGMWRLLAGSTGTSGARTGR
ncbi:MAG TPA: hypothetical protein VGW38_13925 [Chloroflexota bacterium]|nr:hypothetical protein [Chloroflexota bacterium]